MKIATIVEMDVKEIRDTLIAHAKGHNNSKDPGGSSIKFLYAMSGDRSIIGAVVRFGQSVSDEAMGTDEAMGHGRSQAVPAAERAITDEGRSAPALVPGTVDGEPVLLEIIDEEF